jgi:hypothetical protein
VLTARPKRSPPPRTPLKRAARRFRAEQRNARSSCWHGCSRSSSILRSIRWSPPKRPGPVRTSYSERQQSLRGRHIKGPRRLSRTASAQLALVKRDGKLVEEVYKVGGRYSNQIAAIVGHLEAAIPFATPPMADALKALITFYQTGENHDREAYDIAWVKDKASPVDTDQRIHRGLSGRARA